MAIAIVSTSTKAYPDTGDGSVIINKPTGLEVGDLMFGIADSLYADSTLSLPSGWTLVGSATNSTGNGHKMIMGYKIADSSDVAASNFTFDIAGGTRQIGAGLIYRITGYNSTNLVDALSTGTGSFGQPSMSGFTPDKADNLYIMAVSGTNEKTSVSGYTMATDDPSWTESFDDNTDDGPGGTIGVAWATRAAVSATGTAGATFAKTDLLQSVCMLVALSPQIVIDEGSIAHTASWATDGSDSTSNTISATVTISGNSPFLIAVLNTDTQGGGRVSVSSFTLGGEQLTLIGSSDIDTYGKVFYYYFPNPESGEKTLSATLSSTCYRQLVTSLYSGVSTTNPIHQTSIGSPTITSTVDNCWHVLAGLAGSLRSDVGLTAGSGTVRRITIAGRGIAIFDGDSSVSPAGENTLFYTANPALGKIQASFMLTPLITSSLVDTVSTITDEVTCVVRKVIHLEETVGVNEVHTINLIDAVGLEDEVKLRKEWSYEDKPSTGSWTYLDK